MKKAGLFLDTSNLFFCLQNKFKKKLDYTKYKTFLDGLYQIEACRAYVASNGNQNNNFVHAITKIGYTVIEKNVKEYAAEGNVRRKCDMDVTMCIDMVNTYQSLDVVVLGSADGDMLPAVEWLKGKGIEVIILACGISGELKKVAKCIEIPHSLLEE